MAEPEVPKFGIIGADLSGFEGTRPARLLDEEGNFIAEVQVAPLPEIGAPAEQDPGQGQSQ